MTKSILTMEMLILAAFEIPPQTPPSILFLVRDNFIYGVMLWVIKIWFAFKYKKLVPLIDKVDDNEFIKNIYNNEYYIIPTTIDTYSDTEVTEIKKNYLNPKYTNSKNYKIVYIVLFPKWICRYRWCDHAWFHPNLG